MKLLKVAKREYLERVRKKSFLIGTVLGPILMGALIVVPGLIFERTPEGQSNIAVIDQTGSLFDEVSEALGDTLEDGRRQFVLRRVPVGGQDLEKIKQNLGFEVETDLLSGFVVIPEDVVGSGKATYYGKRVGNVRTLECIERALSQVVIGQRLANEGMDYSIVRRMLGGVDLEVMQLRKGEEKRSDFLTNYLTIFIFIMMLYMTILLWGVAVQRSIIEEKNNRVMEILLSSLRPFDLLVGKIFGVGAVGLTQYAIWSIFIFALSAYGLVGAASQLLSEPLMTIIFFVVYYVLGFLFYSTIFAGIGSICNTDHEAQQLQTPVVMCLVFTIIIPMAIIQNPDGMFAIIVSMIPFFSPIVMFVRINAGTPPAWQIALSIAILIGGIYVFGAIAAKIFRIGILMYGKRPDLREVAKWLKRA